MTHLKHRQVEAASVSPRQVLSGCSLKVTPPGVTPQRGEQVGLGARPRISLGLSLGLSVICYLSHRPRVPQRYLGYNQTSNGL